MTTSYGLSTRNHFGTKNVVRPLRTRFPTGDGKHEHNQDALNRTRRRMGLRGNVEVCPEDDSVDHLGE